MYDDSSSLSFYMYDDSSSLSFYMVSEPRAQIWRVFFIAFRQFFRVLKRAMNDVFLNNHFEGEWDLTISLRSFVGRR